MVPRFRCWDERLGLTEVVSIDFFRKKIKINHWEYGDSNFFPLDEVVLMQSTGLKDKNGVEIFEGDILRGTQMLTTTVPSEIKSIVRYSKRNTMHYLDDGCGRHDRYVTTMGNSIFSLEVIGNIYENPELLEEANEN